MADPTTDVSAPAPTSMPDSGGFGAAMSSFGQGVRQSLGGDLGNIFPGYRDMRQQVTETQVRQAETQDLSARAEHQRLINQSMKRQAEIMQQLAGRRAQAVNTAEGQVQTLMDQGSALIAGGEPVAGGDLIEKASLIQAHLATAKREQNQQANQQFTQREKMMADENAVWAGINSPEDQARAAMEWYSSPHPQGAENPYLRDYDPHYVEFKRRTSAAGLEFARDQRAQRAAEETQKDKESAIKFRDSRLDLERQRIQLQRERDARAAKGGVVAKPEQDLQDQALAKIISKYPLLAANEGGWAKYDIASRAMEIVKSNPGVGRAQALEMAFGDAEKNGNFSVVERNYKLFGDVDIPWAKKSETHYKAEGSPANPLPLPNKADPTLLKDGQVYTDGKISMRWKDGTWEALSSKEDALDKGLGVDEEGNIVTPEETE